MKWREERTASPRDFRVFGRVREISVPLPKSRGAQAPNADERLLGALEAPADRTASLPRMVTYPEETDRTSETEL